MGRKELIDAAAGRKKADLVLKNARVVNVFTHRVVEGSVAVKDGTIVGIGAYQGEEEVDLEGAYVLPGLIDAHVHIESSLCPPGEFARAVVPRGTTTIVADPHEIGNVCGLDGIRFMIDASGNLPLDVKFMLPSCVPTTAFEHAGAVLDADALEELIDAPEVLGLGEVMDYPAVIRGDEGVLAKIRLAEGRGKNVDGHGPMIEGKELNAYRIAGITTEHECSTLVEMMDRMARGMYILIREGSAARNLKELIAGVNAANARRCLFCTDDKQIEDILREGHIDFNLRRAVEGGIDPITAIQMATLNPAECYGLRDRGAVAPGYRADLLVVDNLRNLKVDMVYKEGKLVARGGKPLFEAPSISDPRVLNTVHLDSLTPDKFSLELESDLVHVIRLQGHSLITEKGVRKVERNEKGIFQPNPHLDLLKLAVVERHGRTGNIGLGLVENYRLKGGAVATTIAHDSHNLIVIGDNDGDMCVAANALIDAGGGMVIVRNGAVLDLLALPVAGLMSLEPLEVLRDHLIAINLLAYDTLGVNRELDPFMTLAFLSLPVIPELKLTDMGLFDVNKFAFLPLCVENQ